MSEESLRKRIGTALTRGLARARAGAQVDIRKELLADVSDLAERIQQESIPSDIVMALAAAEEFFEAHADLGGCESLEPLIHDGATALAAGQKLEDGPLLRFGFITGRIPFEAGAYTERAISALLGVCGLLAFIFFGHLIYNRLGTAAAMGFVLICGGLLLRTLRTQ